jgi:2-polyprenyl-3-methyl-5-hydroxy-6-metoxy-1,4-benzoquinol methylase
MVNGYMNRRFGARFSPASVLGYWLAFILEPIRLKLDYHGRHLFLAAHREGVRRVLDVGCGNGEFLRRAITMGWESTGIDPDPAAVDACRKQGIDAFVGFIEDEMDNMPVDFDAITLRHSIEHVPDPPAHLARCLELLRPGGMLWMAWPNPSGPGSRVFRASWRGLEVPRHLCVPSARSMKALLRRQGYSNVRLLRRGHHAKGIVRESTQIASLRPGWGNKIRQHLGPLVALWANIAATFSSQGGDELVIVAFAPVGSNARA